LDSSIAAYMAGWSRLFRTGAGSGRSAFWLALETFAVIACLLVIGNHPYERQFARYSGIDPKES
jgi:hypothetical protein